MQMRFDTSKRIFIAGAGGMVGSALVRVLTSLGFNNLLTPSRANLDLRQQQQVVDFFSSNSIDQVIVAAARVGGIYANSTYQADFIYDNLMIASNVIDAAYKSSVERLLYLGSTCIYPRLTPQPMEESSLLTGKPELTNEAYAIAKIAGVKLCQFYYQQHGCDFRAVMPTNLYGLGDNFHPENSHVLPALIRRFHEAKISQDPEVVVWGTGTPTREFLYVDDMAEACIHVLNIHQQQYLQAVGDDAFHINVGTGIDMSIAQLAELVARTVGYTGEIVFDTSKPDGTPKKVSDVRRINALGWQASTSFELGIARVYRWFSERYNAGDFRS